MAQSNELPIFNLKAVVRETGLKADTLRAWERRYGIPAPQRTDSGHRLYSKRDIDTLRWLSARLDEGLSISRAVVLLHELNAQEGGPVPSSPAGAAASAPPAATTSDVPTGSPLTELCDRWVAACLDFDEQSAEHALTSAFALFPVETVCIDLIQRGLAMIGEGWRHGRVTVQQEHFASALALRRIGALLASTPAPTRRERIVVGCPAGEAHTFVPLLLSLLLRRRGWNVVYLGADVPAQDLEATVKTMRPSLVILTAQQLHTAASLYETAQLLVAADVPVAFGGMVFIQHAKLQNVIPGHYLGPTLEQALRRVEDIVVLPHSPAQHPVVKREYVDTLHRFQAQRARIEADVWKALSSFGIPQRVLTAANTMLGRSLCAALLLGDMSFLGDDHTPLEEMLVAHCHMPEQIVRDYIAAYYMAVRATIGDEALPLLVWLSHDSAAAAGDMDPVAVDVAGQPAF
jgi:DNA-binding transcriptional MerR regulator